MDYNFTNISVTAIEQVEKKMGKIRDNILDDIGNFIRILNNPEVLKRSGELSTEVNNLLTDEIKNAVIHYTGLMGKVQQLLKKYL